MQTRAWLMASLLIGCAPPSGQPPDVVWAGWNYTWSVLSHRVSYVRAILGPDETLEMGLVGGDWSTSSSFSDDPNYRMRYQQVRGQDVQLLHGETQLTVGPDGTASVQDSVEMVEDTVVVVLRGFELDTSVSQAPGYPTDYDPALGYTSRGFGFSIGPVAQDMGTATFDVTADVRWGPQDRSNVNEALQWAETGVTVAWTAIGTSGPVVHSALTHDLLLPHSPPNSPQGDASWGTEPVDGTGIMGITAFDLGLEDAAGSGKGEYLRSYGVEVDLGADGASPQRVNAEVTTTSLIEYSQMRFAPDVTLAWVSTCDTDVTVAPVLQEGTHQVGPTEIAPGN